MANEYRFAWQGGGMGHAWFSVSGPEGTGQVEYVCPHHLDAYYRSIHNGDDATWQRDIVCGVHVLRWSYASVKPISQALLDAFNAWRMAERERFVQQLRAEPERYGHIADDDPIMAPPVMLCGAQYVVGTGWVITAQPPAN